MINLKIGKLLILTGVGMSVLGIQATLIMSKWLRNAMSTIEEINGTNTTGRNWNRKVDQR